MSATVSDLEHRIRALSLADKTELLRALIAELDGAPDADVERLWLAEAQRRYRESSDGEVAPVRGDEVFRKLAASLKR